MHRRTANKTPHRPVHCRNFTGYSNENFSKPLTRRIQPAISRHCRTADGECHPGHRFRCRNIPLAVFTAGQNSPYRDRLIITTRQIAVIFTGLTEHFQSSSFTVYFPHTRIYASAPTRTIITIIDTNIPPKNNFCKQIFNIPCKFPTFYHFLQPKHPSSGSQ